MQAIGRSALSTSTALLFAFAALPALADTSRFEGTATLCFIGAVPASVEQKDNGETTYVSDMVSLYYLKTAPVGASPAAGLVNGWELLVSDMKIAGKEYWLDWTGILTPTAYAGTSGTALEETASIQTTDLSMLHGTWLGTGELEGVRVDYVLTVNPDTAPDCPGEQPSQCADVAGGCLPAQPPQPPIVYDISGFVHRP